MEKNEKELISEEQTEPSVPPIDPWSDLLFGRPLKSEKKVQGEEKKEEKEEKGQDDKEQGSFFSWL